VLRFLPLYPLVQTELELTQKGFFLSKPNSVFIKCKGSRTESLSILGYPVSCYCQKHNCQQHLCWGCVRNSRCRQYAILNHLPPAKDCFSWNKAEHTGKSTKGTLQRYQQYSAILKKHHTETSVILAHTQKVTGMAFS